MTDPAAQGRPPFDDSTVQADLRAMAVFQAVDGAVIRHNLKHRRDGTWFHCTPSDRDEDLPDRSLRIDAPDGTSLVIHADDWPPQREAKLEAKVAAFLDSKPPPRGDR